MSVPDPAEESPVADSPDTPAPRLALVVIARNEARAIERCLSSARPWVDEMVVLDTGSTDHTVALARACGARVHHFAWVDDFSAARNAALAHTDAQWTLVLDADEWIEDGADCLSRNRLGDGAFIGVASIRSTFESGGARTSATSSISRLLPRGTRYRGRIHEQPQSNLPRRKIPLVIGHDGYMPDMLEKKRDRNAALLARELADDPESAHVHFHLGGPRGLRALRTGLRPLQTGLGALDAGRRLPPWTDHALDALHGPDRDDAGGDRPGLRADRPVAALAGLLLRHGKPGAGPRGRPPGARARAAAALAQDCWERCLEIGEAPGLEDSVAGRGSFLAAHNLAVVRGGLGHGQGA